MKMLVIAVLIIAACVCAAIVVKHTNCQRQRDEESARKSVLDEIEHRHFLYFKDNQHPDTGLILDRSTDRSPASVAAVGFAFTAYGIAAERGWISREEAAQWAHKVLTTLSTRPMGPEPSGTAGYHGLFYHMLDPETGTRATAPKYWNSELSSIDTSLLMAGILFARNYFSGSVAIETEIRALATALWENVEWNWISDDTGLIHHEWSPERGMSKHGYQGYSEALLMYILALGSDKHQMPDSTWQTFIGEAKPVTQYGQTYVICPDSPLFVYQYPHCWIDFRKIQDPVMQRLGWDWFENSRRATLAQYEYACRNPGNFRGYGALNWGLTACDGPGDVEIEVGGAKRKFWWYVARGCPSGPDDGTIAPTAAISSMPFTPELSMPLLQHWYKERQELIGPWGFWDAYNPTYDPSKPSGWVCSVTLGVDQGPILLMLANHRDETVWKYMKSDTNLQLGLKRAGFTGGWLATVPTQSPGAVSSDRSAS